MEASIQQIAALVIDKYQNLPKNKHRLIIGIAGVPGSGKSTLAYPLTDRINSILANTHTGSAPAEDASELALVEPSKVEKSDIAVCVGLDGWHYSRVDLAKFDNPKEAMRRRGAPFTFDSQSFTSFVINLNQSREPLPFPTFSHSLKDPIPSQFPILPSHKIVIIEGLYSLLDEEPWKTAAEFFDEKIWVNININVARERLVKRCVKEGIEDTEEAAIARVDLSDMPNGEYIRSHLITPTLTVNSVEDFGLVAISAKAGGAPVVKTQAV